ncbi:MAG: type III-A CRISPR-associated protein Cas10/Csm1 [Pseudomonadota bacterium]
MDETVLKIALAGLLHDIGKFAQRAEVPLSPASKGIENSICKINRLGYYSYRHVLYTNEFFELFANHRHLGTTKGEDSISNLASYHHFPTTRLQELIQLADWLSSGSDRHEDEEGTSDREQYKKARLHVIFDYMKLDDQQNKTHEYRYELDPLDGDVENVFPTHLNHLNPKEGEKIVKGYGELWNKFRQELEEIETETTEAFSVVMLSLLEKYTWCIPSSTMHRPDISLFDHAKTTAAIATALYRYHDQCGDLATAKLSAHDKTQKFRLLVGDLSGIQNYIFNIKNVGVGGTAKRLRARSFQLSVLADVASHAVLHAFGLPLTNLVIASGGKFYLLLPNIAEAETIIAKYEHDFGQWLIDNVNGEIAVNIASVPCSCKELLKFNRVLKRVNDALQIAKERALSSCLTVNSGWNTEAFVLNDREFSGEKLCQSCEKFLGTKQIHDDVVLCQHCATDAHLGTDLARAMGVQFFRGNQGEYKLFANYSYSLTQKKADFSKDACLVQQFNDWNFGRTHVALRPRPFANYVPRFDETLCHSCNKSDCGEKDNAMEGNLKFFSCLAEASIGRKALGIFKADVDNLGLIFINGFQSEKEKSISRITALSRLLETFFTGRLHYLLREEFADIYTVYAGGDDLLMLGPWEQILRFSQRMREEFCQFTCGNPAFSLSAGIALAKARLPIYTAIGFADNLLDEAKKQCSIGSDEPKNQLAALDDIIKWDNFEKVQQQANRLAGWQAEKKVSMGFVRQLLDSADQFREFKTTGETSYLRFVPMLAYAISRNIPGKEKDLIAWAHELTNLKSSNLIHLKYIANYSIQTNRS